MLQRSQGLAEFEDSDSETIVEPDEESPSSVETIYRDSVFYELSDFRARNKVV